LIKEQAMNRNKSTSWKMERASISMKGKARPHSNKYSASDRHAKPESGSRQRVWVGGYVKQDGTRVAGHYRSLAKP
jgi:hypothetical protein